MRLIVGLIGVVIMVMNVIMIMLIYRIDILSFWLFYNFHGVGSSCYIMVLLLLQLIVQLRLVRRIAEEYGV